VKNLEAKLDSKYVKTRQVQGTTLTYVEGWHVIAEANRIFGYDGWDRRTVDVNCVWSGKSEGSFAAAMGRKCASRFGLAPSSSRVTAGAAVKLRLPL
jgi:recombination DNA repair RAD52 pathway protein